MDIENGYLQVTRTSIFYTCMLTRCLRVSLYPYPWIPIPTYTRTRYTLIEIKNKLLNINTLIFNELFFIN